MLKLTNPRLRRSNVMLNSFGSCIPDAAKEFSGTPKMPVSKMVSQPRMFFEKVKGTVAFKQLKGFTNTHRRGKFNEQVNVVNSDVQFVNFTFLLASNLPQEKLAIHSDPVKFERVFGIFNFPDKMESILSKTVLPKFQIHFLSPELAGDKAHANFDVYFEESSISTLPNTQTKELNLLEDGDSSQNLKVWVSSPWM